MAEEGKQKARSKKINDLWAIKSGCSRFWAGKSGSPDRGAISFCFLPSTWHLLAMFAETHKIMSKF